MNRKGVLYHSQTDQLQKQRTFSEKSSVNAHGNKDPVTKQHLNPHQDRIQKFHTIPNTHSQALKPVTQHSLLYHPNTLIHYTPDKQIRAHSAQGQISLERKRKDICGNEARKERSNGDCQEKIEEVRKEEEEDYRHPLTIFRDRWGHQDDFKRNEVLVQEIKIDQLRSQYAQQNGSNLIEESLDNHLENSTHYQEELPSTEYLNFSLPQRQEETAPTLSGNSHKMAFKQSPYKKKTFESIKEIIRKQQQDIKEYLYQQRTQTDTTDDQNASNNPNNKSSSEEALITNGYLFQNSGSENNFISSGFKYPQKKITRELSTSHDTTKLIDDDDTIQKGQYPKKGNDQVQVTQFIANRPEKINTHPTIEIRNNKEAFEYPIEQKVTPTLGRQPHKKNNLSIISDIILEEIFEYKIEDYQLCPKWADSQLQNPPYEQRRSHSEKKQPLQKQQQYINLMR